MKLKQSIFTKELKETNTLPVRVKATTSCGLSLTYRQGSLDLFDAHTRAARALADTLNWRERMIPGATKEGYVFVFDAEARV